MDRDAIIRSTLVLTLLLSTPFVGQTHGQNQESSPPPSLLQTIDTQCTDIANKVEEALTEKAESLPDACQEQDDGDGTTTEVDPEGCRSSLAAEVAATLREVFQTSAAALRKTVLLVLESEVENVLEVQRLYADLDRNLDTMLSRSTEKARSLAQEVDPSDLEQLTNDLARKVSDEVGTTCRTELSSQTAQFQYLRELEASLQDSAEIDYYSELTDKDSGFAPSVRCRWLRDSKNGDRLDCKPGLLLNGQDISAIRILRPLGERNFRLAWVQTLTAEQTRRWKGGELTCPRFESGDPRSLTCDELCFQPKGPNCEDSSFREIPTDSAEIAVYFKRALRKNYGCPAFSRLGCAFRKLRGPVSTTPPRREKLSLLVEGKTPFIVVRAMDANGRLATGSVPVGYQRWRVETGGFLAVVTDESGLDKVLMTETVEGEEGKVKVLGTRAEDKYAQDTGVFVNFIPRNYEWFGIGLGFATDDGQAPSVYLGPSLRVRTFGHRGLAALTFGYTMRQVDRFPGLTQDAVYDVGSAELQPDEQFDWAPFVGIQLGFSFGPIQVQSED